MPKQIKTDWNMDGELRNADWLRSMGRWGILPRTVDELLILFKADMTDKKDQRAVVRRIMKLPKAKRMPASLRMALRERGLL